MVVLQIWHAPARWAPALAGAVAAGHERRVYDAVVLKVLGATRRTLARAFLLEYGLLGLITAVIAGAIGSLAAFYVLTDLMELAFTFLPATAAATVGKTGTIRGLPPLPMILRASLAPRGASARVSDKASKMRRPDP